MATHPLRRYVPLPVVPTDEMLLDLALSFWWDDTPGETRDDFARAYQRLQERQPGGPAGFFWAPVEPDEDLLLAIAGLAQFVCDDEDGTCPEFEMGYEGYLLMLRNCQPARSAPPPAPGEVRLRNPLMDSLVQGAATSERYSFKAVCETIGQALTSDRHPVKPSQRAVGRASSGSRSYSAR